MYSVILIALVCVAGNGFVRAYDVNRLKRCGELMCAAFEYCAEQEMLCKQCRDICETDSNNYNAEKCNYNCTDYIYEYQIGYAKKSELHALSDTISKIYLLLVVILILVVLLLTMVGGMFVRLLYRYRKRVMLRKLEEKKFNQKHSSVQYTVSNNAVLNNEPIRTISHAFRNSMPSTTTLTQTDSPMCTNKSTSTTKTLPLSMEEPCEDTTLDYAAYVNQALSHSPSNDTQLTTCSPKF